MPIELINSELTPENKVAVRKMFQDIVDSLAYEQRDNYDFIIEAFNDFTFSRNQLKIQLYNYIFAIIEFLDLTNHNNDLHFDKLYEKQLLASLIYFAEPNDVIPDHVAYIGFSDDAFCVNLAISKQSHKVKEDIEKMVKLLEAVE